MCAVEYACFVPHVFSKSLALDVNTHFLLGYNDLFWVTSLYTLSESLSALVIILNNNTDYLLC